MPVVCSERLARRPPLRKITGRQASRTPLLVVLRRTNGLNRPLRPVYVGYRKLLQTLMAGVLVVAPIRNLQLPLEATLAGRVELVSGVGALPPFDRATLTFRTILMIVMIVSLLITWTACLWWCLVVRVVVWVLVVPLWASPVDLPPRVTPVLDSFPCSPRADAGTGW